MTNHMPVCLAVMLAGGVALAAGVLGPDAAGYTATDETTYSFVNIVPTGVRTLALTDDGVTSANIGFPFALYGQSHASVCISANGYLLFGGCADAFLNQDLSASPAPTDPAVAPVTSGLPIVAPLWSDLTFLWPNADAVYYQTLGVEPSRQFVVQWNNAFPQNSPQPVTMQVILEEGSNQIRFQYLNVDADAGSPTSGGGLATVGICDTNGRATGRCLQWSYNAAVLRSNTAILFDPHTNPVSTPGAMHGNGVLRQASARYEFEFDVRERASGAERGSFRLRVHPDPPRGRGPKPKDSRFASREVTSVLFSDDPSSIPGRKPRPKIMMDTVLFSGVGDWNGRPGHRFEVFATDHGEPGRTRDEIRIKVSTAAGAIVAEAAGELSGGNIQSTRVRK